MIPLLTIFGVTALATLFAKKTSAPATAANQPASSGSGQGAAAATHEMGIPIQPEASIAAAIAKFQSYQTPKLPIAPAPARAISTYSAPAVYGGSYLGTRGRISLL